MWQDDGSVVYNSKWYQCSLGGHSGTVQFWRQTVISVLLWWFLHQLMLRKSRCHTYGTSRTT